ncbi:prevent-host-death protein [Fructobacillus fructosus KCTC 3544]|nr:prevent-host-death protein [Fructobacillus fructosus KCTC 3544]
MTMQSVTYSNVRKNLKRFMQLVNDNAEVVVITSKRSDDNAVLISQDEYENLIENAYLRQSKANVDHINRSLELLRAGQGKTRE